MISNDDSVDLYVVLGAGGGLGSAVTRQLAATGARVRAVNRSGRIPYIPATVEIVATEAIVPEELARVCKGASAIYHCMHPSIDYGLFVPLTKNVIQVAAAEGARLVAAASVFPYGRVEGPMTEDLPDNPVGATGRYHARAARLLAEAAVAGEAQITVGRASHYYGPYARHLWSGLDPLAAINDQPARTIGDIDTQHTYVYVEDFARGLITLGQHEVAFGRVWHLPAAPAVTTRQLVDALYLEAGTAPRLQPLGKPRIFLTSMFSREQQHLRDVLYQFERPYVVDHQRFSDTFEAQITPHKQALRETIRWARSLKQ